MSALYAYKNHAGRAMRQALLFQNLSQSRDQRSLYDFILPVPDDKTRIWRRRHSPAWLLAKHAADALHCPILEILERPIESQAKQAMRTGIMRRLYPPQWTLTLGEKTLPENPTAVLIVDDFIVSGTTIRGIAEVLREQFGPNLTIDALCLGIRRMRKELDEPIGQ